MIDDGVMLALCSASRATPCQPFKGNLAKALDKILGRVFADNDAPTMPGGVREQRAEYLVDWRAEDE
jgi:hypothetical protein